MNDGEQASEVLRACSVISLRSLSLGTKIRLPDNRKPQLASAEAESQASQ